MYTATVLLDSLSPNNVRLTTLRVTMPRIILAEFNTHRNKSRNAGSSRAISFRRRLHQVRESPFIPFEWGLNQKGMSASTTIAEALQSEAEEIWRDAAHSAASFAERLNDLNVHRQVVNRLLEPFVWVDVIVSATSYRNFDKLRISSKAQPEIRETARVMKAARDASTPTVLAWNDWHIPTITFDDQIAIPNCDELLLVAAGRLARVSYEVEGKSATEELALAQRLITDCHWSPFEHVAQCVEGRHADCRNFVTDFRQLRAHYDQDSLLL